MADYRLVDATQLDSDLTTVADAIREKAGTSEPLTFPDGMAAAVANMSVGGGTDYLRVATQAQFNDMNVFGKSSVDITMENATKIASMFQSSLAANTTVEHMTLTCLKPVTTCSACFYAQKPDYTLKHITFNVDISACTILQTMVYLNYALEVIDGTPLDVSACTIDTAFRNAFNGCTALKEVRFAPQTIKAEIGFPQSTQLSADSITSIINGLSPDTSGLTLTLSRAAVNTAFETAEGAADGSTSAEWLALIGTRSNWTVSLV